MSTPSTGRITLERTLATTIADAWDLWTTGAGLEAWWGPDGFAVTVRRLDLRPGGALNYAMTAVEPDKIAFMKAHGMPVSQEASLSYAAVEPRRRLAFVNRVDFVPGVAPYDSAVEALFEPVAGGVRLTVLIDRMHDETWTQRAATGWGQQLGRLEAALRGRGSAR